MNPQKKFEVVWAEPKSEAKSPLNVFNDEKEDLPEFGGKAQEETKD